MQALQGVYIPIWKRVVLNTRRAVNERRIRFIHVRCGGESAGAGSAMK